MIDEPDIWRTANLLLKQHGSNAAFAAAPRADNLLEQGDIEGQLVWKRIVEAIRKLERKEPKSGEAVN